MSYTRMPNDFIDNLKLNPYQFQILSIIVRKTDGWCKIEDGISLSQFEKLVTFKKPKIIQTLKELENMDLISKRKQLLDNNANSFNMYRISERVVIENNKGSNQELQGVVIEDYIQKKTNTKETKQNSNNLIDSFFEDNEDCKRNKITEELITDFIEYRKSIKKPIKTTKALRGFYFNAKDLLNSKFNLTKCLEEMKLKEWLTVDKKYFKNRDDLLDKPKPVYTRKDDGSMI